MRMCKNNSTGIIIHLLFSPLQPISSSACDDGDDDDDNEEIRRGYLELRDDIHTILLNVDIAAAAKDGPSPLGRRRPPAGPERCRVSGLGG